MYSTSGPASTFITCTKLGAYLALVGRPVCGIQERSHARAPPPLPIRTPLPPPSSSRSPKRTGDSSGANLAATPPPRRPSVPEAARFGGAKPSERWADMECVRLLRQRLRPGVHCLFGRRLCCSCSHRYGLLLGGSSWRFPGAAGGAPLGCNSEKCRWRRSGGQTFLLCACKSCLQALWPSGLPL